MASRKWRCTNYDGCSKAEAGEVLQISGPADLCPFCSKPTLLPVAGSASGRWRKVIKWAVVVVAVVATVGLAIARWPSSKKESGSDLAIIDTLEELGPVASEAPMVFPGYKTLTYRVLTRPESALYKTPSIDAEILQSPVPSYTALFVYSVTNRAERGSARATWFEVGRSENGRSQCGNWIGWMKGEDVLEWKHTMVARFTNPADRQPTLFFRNVGELRKLESESRANRTSQMNGLLDKVRAGRVASQDRVLPVREPDGVISEFYMLPVLDFTNSSVDSHKNMLLRVTAAARTRAPRVEENSGTPSTGVKVDVVFVMDLTVSMQPYLDQTVAKMRQLAVTLGASRDSREALRFGFWGYRDSESIAGMEFNTRNFTPELVRIEDFGAILGKISAARTTSGDLPEDVFTGVHKGVTETGWRKDAIRLLVLIGDASGHPVGHPHNQCGMGESSLRALASDRKVWLTSIHILNPGDEQNRGTINDPRNDYPTASLQFRALAQNPDGADPAYIAVPGERDGLTFGRELGRFGDHLVTMIQAAREGRLVAPASGADTNAVIVQRMLRGAMLDWIGQNASATAPRDVTAWISQTDLVRGEGKVVSFHVLLTKSQLNSLAAVVREIYSAALLGRSTSLTIFEHLQSTDVAVFRNPDKIKAATSLKDHVPEFLQDLPYKSRIMSLTRDQWKATSENERGRFIQELASKLKYYQDCDANSDLWGKLNEMDDEDARVATIPVDQLP